MKSVRLFDFIAYDGDSYQVIAQDGARLALKSLTTNRVRHVGVAELLADDSYEPDTPDRLSVLDDAAVLETLDDQTREDTLWLYRHVHEIVHGTPPLALLGSEEITPKPEYAPEAPLLEKIEAKAEELSFTDRALSARALRRHVSAYRRDGVVALVDGRKRRQRKVGRDQDPGLLDLLREEIAAQEKVSTGTRTRVITRVTVRAKGGWKSVVDVEIAVAEYVDWFNHRRLHGEIGLVPPAECEADHWASQPAKHYHQNPVLTEVGSN